MDDGIDWNVVKHQRIVMDGVVLDVAKSDLRVEPLVEDIERP